MDNKRSLSDRYWAQRGWTSANMNGAYVGCPEMPDGSKPVCVCMYVCERERESVCVNNRFMYKYQFLFFNNCEVYCVWFKYGVTKCCDYKHRMEECVSACTNVVVCLQEITHQCEHCQINIFCTYTFVGVQI